MSDIWPLEEKGMELMRSAAWGYTYLGGQAALSGSQRACHLADIAKKAREEREEVPFGNTRAWKSRMFDIYKNIIINCERMARDGVYVYSGGEVRVYDEDEMKCFDIVLKYLQEVDGFHIARYFYKITPNMMWPRILTYTLSWEGGQL